MTCNCGICRHNSLPLLRRLKSHTGTARQNETEAAVEIERLTAIVDRLPETAECDLLKAVFDTVEWLTNPEGTILGLNPGPEQEMLQKAYDEARAYYEEVAADEDVDRRQRQEIDRLLTFVIDCRDNWGCDTGADGRHHPQCRKCKAIRVMFTAQPAERGE